MGLSFLRPLPPVSTLFGYVEKPVFSRILQDGPMLLVPPQKTTNIGNYSVVDCWGDHAWTGQTEVDILQSILILQADPRV